jgi:hypothetical protein
MLLPKWSRKRKPIPPHVETIRAMAIARDARDADEYVSHMTEDVVFIPPGFLMGQKKMHGRDQVKEAFAEFSKVLTADRKIEVTERRYFVDRADENRILIVDEITVSPVTGESGVDTFGTQSAGVFTMAADGRVSRMESWPGEEQGLAQLEDPLAIDV